MLPDFIQLHADLTHRNTLALAARAEFLATITAPEQLLEVARHPDLAGRRRFVLGGGSNLVLTGDFPGLMLAAIPVYALWALPTVGWLLLCSAWSKSKPFLWAIMLPVFSGIFISWFDIMNVFNLESGWFWKNIVARGLLSAVPGTWFDVAHINNAHITSSEAARQIESVHQLLSLKTTYSVLLTPQLWIGAVVGAAMIYGAIRLRRWRDDN